MDRTLTLDFPSGKRIAFSYPQSATMDAVVEKILRHNEYGKLWFIQGKTIVDIGANVGCASVFFAVAHPQATVYALEPAKEAFEYLKKNTSELANVRAFNVGAYDRDTQMELHLGKEASATNSLLPGSMTSEKSETVQLRRISTFLKEQGVEHIDLLKLDTEGVEIAILRDLRPMINSIDAMYVEYHSEEDRLELDRILSNRFVLFTSEAEHPHRGVVSYVARELVAAKTDYDQLRMRPSGLD